MKKYSIKDIANLSGVSVATVSRVINDNGRFSEATRKKVLATINETGYQTNFSAKNLRMNKSFSIGILVPDISNYFFAKLVQTIEEILFNHGYSTVICNTARNADKELAYLKMLESKGIDGLIVISGPKAFDIKQLPAAKNLPFICIDRQPSDQHGTVFIASNHYQGAFEATEALINNGCQHPVIALHQQISSSGIERRNGFIDALKKNNIFFNPEHNQVTIETDHILTTLQAFLKDHPETDGIFAINDTIGIEALTTLLKMGKAVPEDIKLIGFDDDPQDRHSFPTLSSVRQNVDQLAEVSVKNLLNMITHEASPESSIIIPVSLVLRESSR
ncbi:LacI family DNA-binding transcriptional regulator [Lactiplantibacillus herbarum]|uniref:LacI family DNA-binding transcriptional regulator n=1 Tax=Lactiplantibacillus herbarum TaxID=1670446 RepID=UPI00064FDA4C|nr:LacI family DNA-binding transcriptional regulator [Lactiplantibacillus herbarum]